MKIEGADHEFLFGFYYRQIGRFDKALERINNSLKLRENFSKAVANCDVFLYYEIML